MPGRPDENPPPDRFGDAFGAWQLRARTEIKRSSSLPSGMFDACDPMLEARLADSVEGMLHCLHGREEPNPAAHRIEDAPETGQRIERVSQEELQRVPHGLLPATVDRDVDVDGGRAQELLAVLLDACATGDASARNAACDLLARDPTIAAALGPDDGAEGLARSLPQLLGAGAADPEAADQLSGFCRAVAERIVLAGDPATANAQERPQ